MNVTHNVVLAQEIAHMWKNGDNVFLEDGMSILFMIYHNSIR